MSTKYKLITYLNKQFCLLFYGQKKEEEKARTVKIDITTLRSLHSSHVNLERRKFARTFHHNLTRSSLLDIFCRRINS